MADLKPCPFCGSEAKIERHDQSDNCTVYVCRECGCTLPSGDWRDGSSWNDRVCDDEIASLRQQLADAWETAANVPNGTADAIAREEEAFALWRGPDPRGTHVRAQRLAVVRALRASADAIRALSHPDREGERE